MDYTDHTEAATELGAEPDGCTDGPPPWPWVELGLVAVVLAVLVSLLHVVLLALDAMGI